MFIRFILSLSVLAVVGLGQGAFALQDAICFGQEPMRIPHCPNPFIQYTLKISNPGDGYPEFRLFTKTGGCYAYSSLVNGKIQTRIRGYGITDGTLVATSYSDPRNPNGPSTPQKPEVMGKISLFNTERGTLVLTYDGAGRPVPITCKPAR